MQKLNERVKYKDRSYLFSIFKNIFLHEVHAYGLKIQIIPRSWCCWPLCGLIGKTQNIFNSLVFVSTTSSWVWNFIFSPITLWHKLAYMFHFPPLHTHLVLAALLNQLQLIYSHFAFQKFLQTLTGSCPLPLNFDSALLYLFPLFLLLLYFCLRRVLT